MSGFADHDDIAGAGLPDDESRRKVFRAAPFDLNGMIFRRRTKFTLQRLQAILDRGSPLID